MSSVAATVAVFGAAQGGGAAMRMALVSAPCLYGENSAKRFPRALNPVGLTINGSEAAGALAGNTALLVTCALLSVLLLQAAVHCFPRFFAGIDTMGFLRLPSAPFLVFQLLFQSLTYAGMNLILHPQNAVEAAMGGVAVVLCIVVSIVVTYLVVRV